MLTDSDAESGGGAGWADFARPWTLLRRRTQRPSGHHIKPTFSGVESGGSIPANLLEDEIAANTPAEF